MSNGGAAGEALAEASVSGSEGSGGKLTAVGPDEVEGETVPELMPEDFPLPSGATVRDVYEDATLQSA